MATQIITEYPTVPINRKFSWSGIFSGMFLFVAIEATFGMLGLAVFTSVSNPQAANPVGRGLGIGPGIWMVVLSIIALYFAGKLASTHSLTANRNSGMYAGLVTFGMCIAAAFLLMFVAFGGMLATPTALAPVSGTVGAIAAHSSSMADLIISGGYWLFATLILGMIAAGVGGVHGSATCIRRVTERTTTTPTVDTKRVA